MERLNKLCICVKQLAFQTKEIGRNSNFFHVYLSLKGQHFKENTPVSLL